MMDKVNSNKAHTETEPNHGLSSSLVSRYNDALAIKISQLSNDEALWTS